MIPVDFLDLGSRQAVDLALHRLVHKGTIRRLARGLYDYPILPEELMYLLGNEPFNENLFQLFLGWLGELGKKKHRPSPCRSTAVCPAG